MANPPHQPPHMQPLKLPYTLASFSDLPVRGTISVRHMAGSAALSVSVVAVAAAASNNVQCAINPAFKMHLCQHTCSMKAPVRPGPACLSWRSCQLNQIIQFLPANTRYLALCQAHQPHARRVIWPQLTSNINIVHYISRSWTAKAFF